MTQTPAPGIYENIPAEEYRSWDAISKTGLAEFAVDGPGTYRWKIDNGVDKKTKNINLGTAIDTLFFDGDDAFHEQYAVKPQGMKFSTKKGKEWQAEHAHLKILSWDEAADVYGAVAAISKYEPALEYLQDCRTQLSMIWEDPDTGLLVKGRPDFKPNLEGVLGDLKSTEKPSPPAFERTAEKFKYHWQAAIYSDGWHILTGEYIDLFVFAVVQSEAPYRPEICKFEPPDIQKGRDQYKSELGIYAECQRLNKWPLSTGSMQTIRLSQWA